MPKKEESGKEKKKADFGDAFGKGFSDKSIESIRKKFNSNLRNEKDLRDRALLEFLLTTGLRAAAVVSAKFSDLLKSPDGEYVLKYVSKGGKVKLIGLKEEVVHLIKEYHRLSGFTHDFFFLTLPTNANPERHPMTTRSLQSIVEIWGLKTLQGKSGHPHAFRHTVGQAITDTFGIGTAKIALAHENIQTTEKFYVSKYVNPGKMLKDKWKK